MEPNIGMVVPPYVLSDGLEERQGPKMQPKNNQI